jgi:ketosteroid isomerase-like protein
MSRENVELVHEANDAFTRRDLGALLALADPDIEVFPLIARLEGGPYRGRERRDHRADCLANRIGRSRRL